MAIKVPPSKVDPFISKVSLSNFKSVVDQEVDLGRLTLLVGENSSGKSSILQVLRLLQQSLQSESVGDRFPLNGDLIRMGTIEDIRTKRKDLEKNTVSFGVEIVGNPSTIRPGFRRSIHPDRYDPMIVNWGIDINDTVPDEPGSTYIKGLRVMCSNSEQQFQLFLDIKRRGKSKTTPIYYGSSPRGLRWNRRSFFYRGLEADLAFKGTISSSKFSKPVRVSGLTLMGSLPLFVTVKKLARIVLAEEWLNKTIERTERFELHSRRLKLQEKNKKFGEVPIRKGELSDETSLVDFAVEYINNLLKKSEYDISPENLFSKLPILEKELFQRVNNDNQREMIIKKITKNLMTTSQMDVIDHSVLEEDIGLPYIREMIGSIRYLGPLREEPQFIMLTSPTSSTGNIGSKGEFTAAVLYNHLGGHQLLVPVPNNKNKFSESKKITVERVGLIEAIKAWSAYLGLVKDISIEDLAALGLTIKVMPHGVGSALSLPSVGVGVSQLLPVLVLCLLSEPGSVILLEQPELHLHPALQQRLADFFIAMSRSGRQLIVETHSEYIISRLRRRIAEDADDELMKLVKVIFAERDRETGETQYRDLDLTPYGDIEEWPKGFFDQAAEDEREIIRGALKKQKARKPSDLPEDG